MSFMSEISENNGWNDCIEHIVNHLDEFQDKYLYGGEYDYFPDDKLEKWLKSMKRKEH